MKRAFMWLFMLLKRQMKKVSLYVILFCMVGSTFLIRHVAVNFAVNLEIGVMNRGEVQNQGILYEIAENIVEEMERHKGLVKFVKYEDEQMLEDDVRKGEVYAGYVFTEDFFAQVEKQKLEECVEVITAPDSIVSKLANELVFSYVMREYAYQLLVYDTLETGYFDEDDEEIAQALREFYKENLTNGSTFALDYSGVKEVNEHIELDVFDYISPVAKGIIGVLIFLSGLCGALLFYQDKEKGTFGRFTAGETIVVNAVEIFIPVFLTAAAGMVCMAVTGVSEGQISDWVHIFGYIILVTAYCLVLRIFIKKKIVFLTLVPVFMMASLLFCHVFINLSALIPEFEYIARLLPPTYF